MTLRILQYRSGHKGPPPYNGMVVIFVSNYYGVVVKTMTPDYKLGTWHYWGDITQQRDSWVEPNDYFELHIFVKEGVWTIAYNGVDYPVKGDRWYVPVDHSSKLAVTTPELRKITI